MPSVRSSWSPSDPCLSGWSGPAQAITGDEKSAPSPAGTPSAADTLEAALQPDPCSYRFTDAEFAAGTQPTTRDLTGIWLLRAPHSASLIINGDLDWSHESVQKAFVGSSTLNGRTWTRNLDSGVCPINSAGQLDPLPWTASIARDGSLHLLFRRTINTCTPADDREVWDRLAPGASPVLDYLRETSVDVDWIAPTDQGLQGLYVNAENGHLLESRPTEATRTSTP